LLLQDVNWTCSMAGLCNSGSIASLIGTNIYWVRRVLPED